MLKDEQQILERWKEHYSSILNQQNIVDYEVINLIPQYPTYHELGNPITEEEIVKALAQMKNNKAVGIDGIVAEILKTLDSEITPHLKSLFNLIWEREELPHDFGDAITVNIYKNKGDAADCGSYRGISLLAVTGKVFTRIMANRLTPYSDRILPRTQSGFRPSRSTTDSIFILRQLQENTIEQNESLFIAFFDITKAFDSISREALWRVGYCLGLVFPTSSQRFAKACMKITGRESRIMERFLTHF